MIDFGYQWFKFKLNTYYRVRHWWKEKIPWWIAMHLPPKIALFTFVRVYGIKGDCGPEYRLIYDLWDYKYKIGDRNNGEGRDISVSTSEGTHTGVSNIQESRENS